MSRGPEFAIASPHGLDRCIEMDLDWAEVVETLAQPEIVYPSAPRYGRNRWVAVGGRLAVVYTTDWVVITVLWRGRTGRGTDTVAA